MRTELELNSVKRLASGPKWDLNVIEKDRFKQKFNRSMMLKSKSKLHWLHYKKAKS